MSSKIANIPTDESLAMELVRSSAQSDTGPFRTENQDRFLQVEKLDFCLYAVADGGRGRERVGLLPLNTPSTPGGNFLALRLSYRNITFRELLVHAHRRIVSESHEKSGSRGDGDNICRLGDNRR